MTILREASIKQTRNKDIRAVSTGRGFPDYILSSFAITVNCPDRLLSRTSPGTVKKSLYSILLSFVDVGNIPTQAGI